MIGSIAVILLLPACGDGTREAGTAEPTASPTPARPTRLTVAAAGDLFVQPALVAQAKADARAAGESGYDFGQIMAAIVPPIQAADLAVCHVEQPLGPEQGPFTGFPIFNSPVELADAAAATGFDTCSTASNHTLDYGAEGVARTLDHLDRVGLRHTGSARSARESSMPNVFDVRGVTVAQLSYTFSFNGIDRPPGQAWIANLIDPKAILAEAKRARAAGAEIVIASLHWGTEYMNEADIGQLGLAKKLLASPDIDLIIGMHAHVVQPFEKIGDKWVAYGLGNLLVRFQDGSPENTADSVLPTFTFTEVAPRSWKVTAVEVRPIFMDYYPAVRLVDLTTAKNGGGDRADDYARIHRRIAGYVNMRGAATDGLRVTDGLAAVATAPAR
ncbi:CapA family protein [Phytohabitans houttuyneae]|uniref:Poly-gamma-glutamate biosynthesis protein n=1 Tax=Phytohabitans houttuyneae TaxID=1076126 RepID=A0A6V8KM79_9ACTN|nr:CapA family protein [Phytohabitans houttuyneae]GFJ83319.1 poly-gamma-glutamate biosynthesis protein [Phytohabitans houttuyneae]